MPTDDISEKIGDYLKNPIPMNFKFSLIIITQLHVICIFLYYH